MIWENYIVDKDITIKEGMAIIGERRVSTLIVVDKTKKMIGTVTDGDFRRAILNRVSLSMKIYKISNKQPKFIKTNNNLDKNEIDKNEMEGIYVYPIVNDKKRLTGIFDCHNPTKKNELNFSNKVLILAGGLGTRLNNITKKIPKPLIKIGNKPILETSMRNIASYGFRNFYISVNYKKEKIISHLNNIKSFKGKIEYLKEDMPLGTIGPFGLMKDLKSSTIVINGDIITKVNFQNLLNFHNTNNADATICIKMIENSVPYGVLSTSGIRLKSFEEKPKKNVKINAGIYVFNPSVRKMVKKNSQMDLPDLIKKLLVNKMKVICFPIHEYWIDVGEISTLERANLEFNDLEFNFND